MGQPSVAGPNVDRFQQPWLGVGGTCCSVFESLKLCHVKLCCTRLLSSTPNLYIFHCSFEWMEKLSKTQRWKNVQTLCLRHVFPWLCNFLGYIATNSMLSLVFSPVFSLVFWVVSDCPHHSDSCVGLLDDDDPVTTAFLVPSLLQTYMTIFLSTIASLNISKGDQ